MDARAGGSEKRSGDVLPEDPPWPTGTATENVGVLVLERLREQPGGPQLIALAQARRGIYLVGGAVRDLLLGYAPRELDVVLDRPELPLSRDALVLARDLTSRLGALAGDEGPVEHERFGTAIVAWSEGRIDIAVTRRERYPHGGALPDVDAAPLDVDLLRRDFTINALAVALGDPHPGELREVPHALDDLREERLRVIHDASFEDDPTRLLRLARYRARLGFGVEAHTEDLARRALSGGALSTVSGARVGAEFRLALRETGAAAALEAMQRLGVLAAVHPRIRYDNALVERARGLLPADGRVSILLLASLMLPLVLRADGQPQAEARALLDRLEFAQGERDGVVASATGAVRLRELLPRCERPAELHTAVADTPVEGVALAGALGAADAARRWLEDVRHVRLAINGEDLLAQGVPQGPEIGRRLRETLLLRLDGELEAGREAELAAALGLP